VVSPEKLDRILRTLPQPKNYHLAFSGGLDSTVLLHLLAVGGIALKGRLHAIHIHHGLQPGAERWSEHCQGFCQRLAVPFTRIDLELEPSTGESLEALARERRYGALAQQMSPGDLLLTAHHQDDQAETLLLQMIRGGGPAGLAAMPRLREFPPGWLARPLLDFSRQELADYAEQQGLEWMDDPSNQDQRFDRNFIRHRILPELRRRWPSVATSLARSARISGELKHACDELAASDLEQSAGDQADTLSISALKALPETRGRNLLRHWISTREEGALPGSRHLQRITEEVINCREDAQPVVHWAHHEVRRYRDNLYLLDEYPPHDPSRCFRWLGDGPLEMGPGLGRLHLQPSTRGLSLQLWRAARVEVRFRQGGERMQLEGRTHRQDLKSLLQQWGIPPWERERLPLIYLDGALAAIPGFAISAAFLAKDGEPAVLPMLSEHTDSRANDT
jgi:tRNA(Ile)-lysidine synthase